jgi:hypothetical protein
LWIAAKNCSWLLVVVCGCQWLPFAANGCPWLLMATYQWIPLAWWLPLDDNSYSWMQIFALGCQWLLIAADGFPWLLLTALNRVNTLQCPLFTFFFYAVNHRILYHHFSSSYCCMAWKSWGRSDLEIPYTTRVGR